MGKYVNVTTARLNVYLEQGIAKIPPGGTIECGQKWVKAELKGRQLMDFDEFKAMKEAELEASMPAAVVPPEPAPDVDTAPDEADKPEE